MRCVSRAAVATGATRLRLAASIRARLAFFCQKTKNNVALRPIKYGFTIENIYKQ
jgi:hypothetical protein